MAEINVTGLNDDSVTIVANRSEDDYINSQLFALRSAVLSVALPLGVPGNVLSAIVWLRHRVASSAVYLAALAINDLAFLLFISVETFFCRPTEDWLCEYLRLSAFDLEPLLVLGFSVERVIAVLRPYQVCSMLYGPTFSTIIGNAIKQ